MLIGVITWLASELPMAQTIDRCLLSVLRRGGTGVGEGLKGPLPSPRTTAESAADSHWLAKNHPHLTSLPEKLFCSLRRKDWTWGRFLERIGLEKWEFLPYLPFREKLLHREYNRKCYFILFRILTLLSIPDVFVTSSFPFAYLMTSHRFFSGDFLPIVCSFPRDTSRTPIWKIMLTLFLTFITWITLFQNYSTFETSFAIYNCLSMFLLHFVAIAFLCFYYILLQLSFYVTTQLFVTKNHMFWHKKNLQNWNYFEIIQKCMINVPYYLRLAIHESTLRTSKKNKKWQGSIPLCGHDFVRAVLQSITDTFLTEKKRIVVFQSFLFKIHLTYHTPELFQFDLSQTEKYFKSPKVKTLKH